MKNCQVYISDSKPLKKTNLHCTAVVLNYYKHATAGPGAYPRAISLLNRMIYIQSICEYVTTYIYTHTNIFVVLSQIRIILQACGMILLIVHPVLCQSEFYTQRAQKTQISHCIIVS